MNRLIAKNAAANIVQMVVSTFLVFALYRAISSRLGVDALGVWSVVLASISAARLSEFGLSASVTRFVALYSAKGDRGRIPELVGTAMITLFVGIGLLLPVIYLAIIAVLPKIFIGSNLVVAKGILPYALLSFLISILSGVVLSALDGLQYMVIRSYIFMGGQVILTILGILLIEYYDIVGLAYAQIAQGVFLAAASIITLRLKLSGYSITNYRFSLQTLREMFGYGVNVQAGVFFMSMLDPITKALLARYGGPESAGYFEIANQIVSRARALLTSANQAIVPHIATIDNQADDVIKSTYQNNLHIVVYVAIFLFGLLISWSHILSIVILGGININFLNIYYIVAIGWMVNLFSSPSYFINQGTGKVGLNTAAIGIMGLLNIVLGVLFGHFWNVLGVVAAYSMAISAGGLFLITKFNHEYRYQINSKTLLEYRYLILSFIVACLSAVLMVMGFAEELFNYLAFAFSNVLIIVTALKHPIFSAYVMPVFRRK